MIVNKFGGTSVGDAGRFANVADIVAGQHAQTLGAVRGVPVVVVSAMATVTNQLLDGAWAAADGDVETFQSTKAALLDKHLQVVDALLRGSPDRIEVGGFVEDRLGELDRLYRSIAVLGEVTVRGLDTVASFGEQLSSTILAAVLRDRGVRAEAIHAAEVVVTDDQFGQAAPLMGRTRDRLQRRVLPLIDRGVVPVITGFIGATERGVTTTLGRGGSDFSAAIIGAGLDADEVWIWSDVDGILTADPNIVPQARTLSELSYTEAANLAYYGASVLHPKTIRPVIERGIPLRIVNSFSPTHPGTLIVETPSEGRDLLPAIISTTGLSLIAIGSHDDARGSGGWTLETAARALQRLDEAGVYVPMFSQSFSEHSLNLVVRKQDQARCLAILCREFATDREDSTCSLGVNEDVATISVVGVPGWNEMGIVSHAFAALGNHHTRVIAVAQAATEYSVSFCVPEDQMTEAVRYLHCELGLER
jgi:aspartate kinase